MKLRSKIGVGLLSALVLATSLTALPAQAQPTPHAATPSFYEGELVAFDPNGTLWVYQGDARIPDAGIVSRTKIGSGWSGMRDIKTSDWDQDGVQDIIAVAKDGSLYVYYGRPAGGFTRVAIGHGWGSYDISVAKWKKSDRYPSIIAANLETGILYNYPNLSGTKLSSKVIEGRGWGPALTHHLVDYNEDGGYDVLAQKMSTGDMFLYRTDGEGNFLNEPRMVVSRGWNVMNEIEARSVLPGFLARTANGDLYHYGLFRGRWIPPQKIGTGWNGYTFAA